MFPPLHTRSIPLDPKEPTAYPSERRVLPRARPDDKPIFQRPLLCRATRPTRTIGDHALVQHADGRRSRGDKDKREYRMHETRDTPGNHPSRKLARGAEMLTVGLPHRGGVFGERQSLHESFPSTSKVERTLAQRPQNKIAILTSHRRVLGISFYLYWPG